jgi:hypothetical protein
MKPKPPLITRHRVARLKAWAMLWLQGFSAAFPFLLDFDRDAVRRRIARMARFSAILVFLHVAVNFTPRRGRSWRPARRAGVLRAVIGVRLRRRLRARDPVAQFFAILSLMRDFDAEVAKLRKRLALGLTRRQNVAPAHEHARAWPPADPLAAICAADTS